MQNFSNLQSKKECKYFPRRNAAFFSGAAGGFGMIEAVVFLFIFSVVTLSFYGGFKVGMSFIIDAKNRLGALELANEKMEIIRNMQYADVGTKVINADSSISYGVPPGELLQDEDVEVNTRPYHVHIDVRYYDDPFDSTASSDPPDTVNTDYKKVRVDVTWQWEGRGRSVFLVTDIVPDGVETSSGGGTLVINVNDSLAQPVPQVNVLVTNNSISPPVAVNTATDNQGSLLLPGVPHSSNQNTYAIRVSKNDYETLETLPLYPDSPFDPVFGHAMVLEGELTSVYLEIDKTSDLTVKSLDTDNNPLASVSFSIEGGRKIGTTVGDGSPVYLVTGSYSTGGDGQKTFSDIAGGGYTLEPEVSIPGYKLFDTVPSKEFDVAPGTSTEVLLVFADTGKNSLIVTVTDNNAEPQPIAGASVRLHNDSLGYDETQVTSGSGRVYLPAPGINLQPDQYDLEISALGYQIRNTTVNINELVEETIELIPGGS